MFTEAPQVAEAAKQIAQGFYYIWDWPEGKVDILWLEARSDWNKAVRKILQRNREGLDSPALVNDACEEVHTGKKIPEITSEIMQAWYVWGTQKHKPQPPIKVVWLSLALLEDALKWATQDSKPRIIWYKHKEIEEQLSKHIPVFGAGTDPPEDHPVTCAMSIASQGEGKNLHGWAHNLVLCPPSSGQPWEQLLGRTHRAKQQSDEVWCTYYDNLKPFSSAMRKAYASAQYFQASLGVPQKLLYATNI
jgi:hypothetical protein